MFLLVSLVALLLGLLANTVWNTKQKNALQKRTAEIRACPENHERLFVVLNLAEEKDAHYVVANLFANARWPQAVFVGAALSEDTAQRVHVLLRRRLESLGQPPALADNLRVSVIYSRVDVASQIVDDCYQNEPVLMVTQGQALFTEHFDTRLVDSLRLRSHAIITEFSPTGNTQLAGFPVVVGSSHVRIRHFRRKVDDLVPVILASHQLFAFHANSLALVDLDYTQFSHQALRFAERARKRGAPILSSTSPLVIMPRTDAFARPRVRVQGAAFDRGSFRQQHGLAETVSDPEAVAKIGSKRRYEELLRTQRKKYHRSHKADDESTDAGHTGGGGSGPVLRNLP